MKNIDRTNLNEEIGKNAVLVKKSNRNQNLKEEISQPQNENNLTDRKFIKNNLSLIISLLLGGVFSNVGYAETTQMLYTGSQTLTLSGELDGNFNILIGDTTGTKLGVVVKKNGSPVGSNTELTIDYTNGLTPSYVISGYKVFQTNDNSESFSNNNNNVIVKNGVVFGSLFSGLNSAIDYKSFQCNLQNTCEENTLQFDISDKYMNSSNNVISFEKDTQISEQKVNLFSGISNQKVLIENSNSGRNERRYGPFLYQSYLLNNTITSNENSILINSSSKNFNKINSGESSINLNINKFQTNDPNENIAIMDTFMNFYNTIENNKLKSNKNIITIRTNNSEFGDISAGRSAFDSVNENIILGKASQSFYFYYTYNLLLKNINMESNENSIIVSGNNNILTNIYSGSSTLLSKNIDIKDYSWVGVNKDIDGLKLNSNNNKIELNGSSFVTGNIITGYTKLDLNDRDEFIDLRLQYYLNKLNNIESNATGNAININGSHVFDQNNSIKIYGGYFDYNVAADKKIITYDVFTGNTLNYYNSVPINIKEIGNFQNYNFIIHSDSTIHDPSTPFITANKIVLGSHVSNMSDTSQGLKSEIHVTEIAGDKEIANNTKYILMQARDINGLIENSNGAHLVESVAQQGLSRVYDVDTYIEGNNVVAVFEGSQDDNGVETNPQLDALLLGNLSGLMLLTRNGDLLSDNLFNAISEQNYQRGLTPFIITSGNHTKYETGRHSNIKSDGALTTIGLSWQDEQTTLGAFIENGWDSYTTFNGFTDVANVSGKGHNRFNGFGLYGHYDFMNGWYADATLRGGRLHTAFETDDLRNVETDERAAYNLSTNYYGANLEGGYSIKFDPKNTVNLKAKYLWAQTDSQDLTIASEQIHFNKLDSHRIQFHIENLNQITPELTFISSLGYEHEFTGKAQGHASSHGFFEMDDQSVKGGTGISTLGLRYNPSQYKNLTLDVKATGYIGKREGGIGMLKVDYAF